MTLEPHTIADIRTGLERKTWSCRELVNSYLDSAKIKDKSLASFLRFRPAALDEAADVDARIGRGELLRPLEGVPVAVKDNMLLAGETATAASKILANYNAVYTATAVQKFRDAGAIIIGQTNLDEFAMGASTENSAYQPTRNPWDVGRVPGGSSGGSAAAVASDQVVAALGSDTGGSIRQPAGFCNVVGMKPTYGRVSRYGLIALASSLDQIGPLTRTVADAQKVYQVIAGPDACDPTTAPAAPDDVSETMRQSIKDMRIGWPKEFFGAGVDPNVRAVVEAAAKVYEELGATLSEVSLPHTPQALATYYVILPAEASSNLARFDGIRYGLSVRQNQGLDMIYRQTRAKGFGPEVKRRIMIGTFSLSSGYSDAYYGQATRVRSLIREEFDQVFDQVDILLAPTSPTTAFPLGEKVDDPLTMYLADLLTVPANLANIPAMSIPAGFIDGLPVGLQLMARQWDEARLFQAGYAYQQATDWHTKLPPT
ncbi:MAG: Asp-tRNA(Asn)/Glu-tRNA(Gln) amidotransferase subunit GatA [Candidatus Kerfeldbacteria bacterium]|nr:Asp-tRNA(Asn)/Glu-tRNA(Gln) amidotransferase subunit GatA [Candidatus Kerfeldbacteria bacterium]